MTRVRVVRTISFREIAVGRIGGPVGRKIRIKPPRIRVDDRVIHTRDAHVGLNVGAVGEDALDSRTVVHRQIQAGDGAVTPAHDGDTLDVQVVKHGDGVAREVVVVEAGEVCVGTSAFAAGAEIVDLVCSNVIKGLGQHSLLENDLTSFGQIIRLVVHVVAAAGAAVEEEDGRLGRVRLVERRVPEVHPGGQIQVPTSVSVGQGARVGLPFPTRLGGVVGAAWTGCPPRVRRPGSGGLVLALAFGDHVRMSDAR